MNQIKQRLYGSYILVVAVFILLLSFLLQNIVEGRLVEQQKETIHDEIAELANYIYTENYYYYKNSFLIYIIIHISQTTLLIKKYYYTINILPTL